MSDLFYNETCKKKILIVATVGMFLDFEKNDIEILQALGYEIHCAANFKHSEPTIDLEKNVIKHQVDFNRTPYTLSNILAFKQLNKLLYQNKYEILHCHTPVAALISRLCSKKYRKKGLILIYTAHGFHFYKGAPLKNWILYFPLEWICSWMTDILITINKEDYSLAKKYFHALLIKKIPGVGIETQNYMVTEKDKYNKIRINTRKKLGLSENDFVIVSVGELNYNKNHATVIKAISKITNENVKYIICGDGNLKEYLNKLLQKYNITDRVKLLGYRTDIKNILYASDVFAFPSLREGLGLAAIEAMSTGLPLITSNIHGINDYSQNEITGFTCRPKSVSDFTNAINKLLTNKKTYKLFSTNVINVCKKYDISKVSAIMQKIYTDDLKVLRNQSTEFNSNNSRKKIYDRKYMIRK